MIFLTSKFYLPCFRTLASGDKVFFKFSATVSAILPQWSSKKTQQISAFEIQRKRFRIEKFKGRSFHNQLSVFKSSRNAPLDLRMSHFHPTCFVPSLPSGQNLLPVPFTFYFFSCFPNMLGKNCSGFCFCFHPLKELY